MKQRAEIHRVASSEEFTEFVYEQGWTDGLPVFPPTRKVVTEMLNYIGRNPDEILGAVFPGDGEATIENVVINCAMAGCLPQYVPVVIAAVEGLVDPTLLITTTQSTDSGAILSIVTGPVVSALKFHTREWIFGPNGGRANATIGRAIRLILWNIGRAHPGKLIKGTMGNPAAWSYCIGEEQELTPWGPMHVEFGLKPTDNAITVVKASEHIQFRAPVNTVGVEECIAIFAHAISRLAASTATAKRSYVFVINPSLAAALEKAGYSRPLIGAAIAKQAFKYTYDDWHRETPQDVNASTANTVNQGLRKRSVSRSPVTADEIRVVVGGGEGPQNGQCVLISSSSNIGLTMVTKKIQIPI